MDTNKLLEKALEKKACPAAIQFLIEKKGAKITEDEIKSHPEWYLFACAYLELEPKEKLIAYCAKQTPERALVYYSKHLPQKIFEYCVKEPAVALNLFFLTLSPKLLEYCVKKEPNRALLHSKTLPTSLFEYCAKKHPMTSLSSCRDRIIEDKNLLEYFIKKNPAEVLRSGTYYRLTISQIEKCAREEDRTAIFFRGNDLPQKIFEYCAKKNPDYAIDMFKNRLTPKLKAYCENKLKKIQGLPYVRNI